MPESSGEASELRSRCLWWLSGYATLAVVTLGLVGLPAAGCGFTWVTANSGWQAHCVPGHHAAYWR